jgi:hypothetical protein
MSMTVAIASAAPAATLIFKGSSFIALGETAPDIFTGTGVATVGSGGGGAQHLGTFRVACDNPGFPGGCPISGTQTTPLTDPNNATLITLVATARLGPGTFTGISGAPAAINGNNTLPIPGNSILCLLFGGCAATLPVPLTVNGSIGVGLGGIVTVNTFADVGVKISVFGAPWTVGVASTATVRTPNDALGTRSTTGFVHGPASASSTAAQVGGVLQTVMATAVRTNLNPESDAIFARAFARFEFIPEPGLLLLLTSGIAGLVALGRSRTRK